MMTGKPLSSTSDGYAARSLFQSGTNRPDAESEVLRVSRTGVGFAQEEIEVAALVGLQHAILK